MKRGKRGENKVMNISLSGLILVFFFLFALGFFSGQHYVLKKILDPLDSSALPQICRLLDFQHWIISRLAVTSRRYEH